MPLKIVHRRRDSEVDTLFIHIYLPVDEVVALLGILNLLWRLTDDLGVLSSNLPIDIDVKSSYAHIEKTLDL